MSGLARSGARVLVFVLICAPACAPRHDATEAWPVTGTVLSVDAARGQAVIAHDEIVGLMPPMTMPFRFENPQELLDLEAGDRVAADYVSVPGIGPCLRGVTKLVQEPAQPPP